VGDVRRSGRRRVADELSLALREGDVRSRRFPTRIRTPSSTTRSRMRSAAVPRSPEPPRFVRGIRTSRSGRRTTALRRCERRFKPAMTMNHELAAVESRKPLRGRRAGPAFPEPTLAMSPSRLDAFRQMVAKNPANALAQYGLANEAMKEGSYQEAADHYAVYLGSYDDRGQRVGPLRRGARGARASYRRAAGVAIGHCGGASLWSSQHGVGAGVPAGVAHVLTSAADSRWLMIVATCAGDSSGV